jgi:RNA methyltransferase, TrmH family
MLSKNQIKHITSLQQKKYRKEEGVFIAEGEKVVNALLASSYFTSNIYATQEFFQRLSGEVRISKDTEMNLVTENELSKISALTTPQKVLAIAHIPNTTEIPEITLPALVLERISDPGNMGTILRIAHWFGIDHVICSEDSVDVYNPKVVQGSMGSLFCVNVHYKDLQDFFAGSASPIEVYGTFMEGENIYLSPLTASAYYVFGNESVGISLELEKYISKKISIPSYSTSPPDSLNVAVAAALVCSEIRKNDLARMTDE